MPRSDIPSRPTNRLVPAGTWPVAVATSWCSLGTGLVACARITATQHGSMISSPATCPGSLAVSTLWPHAGGYAATAT
jgi:hypothetical protein